MRTHRFAGCHWLRQCSTALLPNAARFFVVAGALMAAAPACAVVMPGGDMTGTVQDFDLTIDLTGNVFANGSGSVVNTKKVIEPFKFKAPLNHPLGLFGGSPVSISSDPQSDPLGTTFDTTPDQLVDIYDLDLDLLNGTTADFALDTIFLTTNSTVSLLKSISIDVSGTLTGLRFDQTGPATVLGGPGSGTFSVDGEITANVDNLLAVAFGLLQVPVDSQSVVLPMGLQGTWTFSGLSNPKLALDGNLALSIPLSLLTNLTTSITDVLSLTISSTIDLAASLTLDAQYHLVPDICLLCPEPGSIVLLGIGLSAALATALHRRRVARRRG